MKEKDRRLRGRVGSKGKDSKCEVRRSIALKREIESLLAKWPGAKVGIDSPFGWPEAFAEAVGDVEHPEAVGEAIWQSPG